MKQLPLYHRYPNEINPQPACIEFSLRGGPITTVIGEIGNTVPSNVWHGVTLRIPVSPFVTHEALYGFLTDPEVLGLVQAVRDNADIVSRNGHYEARLNEAAKEALEKLTELAEQIKTLEVWEPKDWLGSSLTYRDGVYYLDGVPITPENVDAIITAVPNQYGNAVCPDLYYWLRATASRNAIVLAEDDK